MNIRTELAIKNKKKTTMIKTLETQSLKNITICWMYSKRERRRGYHTTNQGSIEESTWTQETGYQSKRYTPSVSDNLAEPDRYIKDNENR